VAEPTVPSHQPRVTGTDTRNPLQPHAQVLAVRLIPTAGIAVHLRREDRAAFRQIDAQPFDGAVPGRAHQWRCLSLLSLGSGFAICLPSLPSISILNCDNYSHTRMCDGLLMVVWCCRKTITAAYRYVPWSGPTAGWHQMMPKTHMSQKTHNGFDR